MSRLSGIRVLVTRPRERAEELCFLLEDEGAEVVVLPLLELLPPEDDRPLRAAAEHIQRYPWIVFASPSAVQALVEAVRQAGAFDHLERAKLAVVGPRTAQTVREYGLHVTVEATQSTGAGLFADLQPFLKPSDEVLLPAAQDGRTELVEALVEHGFRATRVAAYRSVPAEAEAAQLKQLMSSPPHVLLFASPRTAEALLQVSEDAGAQLLRSARRVAIGPTTAQALERLGYPASAVAERPTSEALVEAAIRVTQAS